MPVSTTPGSTPAVCSLPTTSSGCSLPTTSASTSINANQYIDSICNNDISCKIYYNKILIESQYSNKGPTEHQPSTEDKGTREDKGRSEDKQQNWINTLINVPSWTLPPTESSNKNSSPIDNYSYYGALESKGSQFMPVNADFSSFRK